MFHYVNLRLLAIPVFVIFALIVGVLSACASSTQVLPIQTTQTTNTPWLSISGRYLKDSSDKNVILRGVSLLGIDSVQCPQPLRREAWQRLARDLDRAKLSAITREVAFADLMEAGRDILAGKLRGRTVVRIG